MIASLDLDGRGCRSRPVGYSPDRMGQLGAADTDGKPTWDRAPVGGSVLRMSQLHMNCVGCPGAFLFLRSDGVCGEASAEEQRDDGEDGEYRQGGA